jgi:hypothetical protein
MKKMRTDIERFEFIVGNGYYGLLDPVNYGPEWYDDKERLNIVRKAIDEVMDYDTN